MSPLRSWTPGRLGLADLLDGAWEVFARRAWVYLLLGALPVAAGALLPLPPEHAAWRYLLSMTPLALAITVLSSWLGIAVIRLADGEAREERPGLGAALVSSLPALVPLLLTGLLMIVILFLPWMLATFIATMVVALIVTLASSGTPPSRPVIGLALGIPAAIIAVPVLLQSTLWMLFPQAVALRGRRGWGALARSRELMRGRFWRVLGMIVVLTIPGLLLAVLDSLVPHARWARLAAATPGIAISPFVTICLTLLFLNLEATGPQPARTGPAPDVLSPSPTGDSMKILVLGGGAQGRVIAADLAARLPQASIAVADVRDPRLPGRPNLRWIEADCSSPATVVPLMREHDLAVGALPSRFGFGAMKAAIEARRNLVDVSFSAEDPLVLDAEARAAGVSIVPDAGLAPGISNLLAGEACARRGAPAELLIMVGGVAQDTAAPYGYCVTWSLDDLTEEYVRPARIVHEGRKVTVPVFSGLERVQVEGVGTMEAFYSDGLRTLMDTLPGVPEMGEKTLRWPGHAEAVQPLVAAGRLAEELRACCSLDPPRDLVALVVRMRWPDGEELTTLVDRYDPASGLTAMARTTAFTTAVTAHMLASGLVPPPGVRPLEKVAEDPRAFRFVLDGLLDHGVRLDRGAV